MSIHVICIEDIRMGHLTANWKNILIILDEMKDSDLETREGRKLLCLLVCDYHEGQLYN